MVERIVRLDPVCLSPALNDAINLFCREVLLPRGYLADAQWRDDGLRAPKAEVVQHVVEMWRETVVNEHVDERSVEQLREHLVSLLATDPATRNEAADQVTDISKNLQPWHVELLARTLVLARLGETEQSCREAQLNALADLAVHHALPPEALALLRYIEHQELGVSEEEHWQDLFAPETALDLPRPLEHLDDLLFGTQPKDYTARTWESIAKDLVRRLGETMGKVLRIEHLEAKNGFSAKVATVCDTLLETKWTGVVRCQLVEKVPTASATLSPSIDGRPVAPDGDGEQANLAYRRQESGRGLWVMSGWRRDVTRGR